MTIKPKFKAPFVTIPACCTILTITWGEKGERAYMNLTTYLGRWRPCPPTMAVASWKEGGHSTWASQPSSYWKPLIRQPMKWDLCTPVLLASFINASQILPCAAADPSGLTVGEADVYNLHWAWTESVIKPIMLWLRRITGKRRRREHWSMNKATSNVVSGKGGNVMPWFIARSWKSFVFSALWPPGLCCWEPLTALFLCAIKSWEPKLDTALGQGSQPGCCAHAISLSGR